MLILPKKLTEIDIGQLMLVYEESNRELGALRYPRCAEAEQRLRAEHDLLDYLYSSLKEQRITLAVWAPNGCYKAALRLEPYADGLLLTALETIPEARRMGHAEALLRNVILSVDVDAIYSHVHKGNIASCKLHEKCGFLPMKDYAVYLDGSVSTGAYTYVFKPE